MTTSRTKTIQAISEALDNGDHTALISILDEYKGSYSVKMVLELLLDRRAGHTIGAVIDVLNKF